MTATAGETLPASAAYQLWAESYDQDHNPMLQLEQRWLAPLLPHAAGLSVVDVGCGTGRWLSCLAAQRPASLVGVDSSPSMIAHAEAKQIPNARLLLAECYAVPVDDAYADLVLASFLPGYVHDLPRFATEMARICRSEALVFISDIHPATAKQLGWERAFRAGECKYTIETYPYDISGLIDHFRTASFELACFFEPVFEELELRVLEKHGKQTPADIALHPAIYIAGFRKLPLRRASRSKSLMLATARVAIGPEEAITANLQVSEGRINKLIACPVGLVEPTACTIDLTGYLLLPGLINSHDHLEFALFPRLGSGPYQNVQEWAESIYHPDTSPIAEHRKLDKATRLLWGGLRNLLSGVTTVCHHNEFNTDVFEHEFPVHVIKNIGWAHSLHFDLQALAKLRAAHPDHPFIIHLGEGRDENSAQEIFALANAGALDSRTVIVHGLALTDRGFQLLHESGAALIWCPTSNHFLFGHTHASETISKMKNAVLGSDSPLTAAGDLLDEIRFACHSVGVPAEDIYSQVTSRAAWVLRLQDGQGHIQIGGVADLFAVHDLGSSPAERLTNLSVADVELVILRGEVQLASAEMLDRLPDEDGLIAGLCPLLLEGRLRWVRAPLARMFRDTYSALRTEWMLGGKEVQYALAEWL